MAYYAYCYFNMVSLRASVAQTYYDLKTSGTIVAAKEARACAFENPGCDRPVGKQEAIIITV